MSTITPIPHVKTRLARLRVGTLDGMARSDTPHLHLVPAGRFALIGALSAGIAHRQKNDLFAVASLLELAIRKPGTPEQIERLLALREGTDSLADCSRALLELATESTEEVALAPAMLARECTELLELIGLNKLVETDIHFEQGLPLIVASPAELRAALLALLLNATQALPDGGTISLHVETDEEGSVCFEISDSGGGIADELGESIFEPFVTTRAEGAPGLGLATARAVAESHGGELAHIGSGELGGACFLLTIPAAA